MHEFFCKQYDLEQATRVRNIKILVQLQLQKNPSLNPSLTFMQNITQWAKSPKKTV